MDIRIVPYSSESEAAAKALNARLRAAGESVVFVPEIAPAPSPDGARIRNLYFVALEERSMRGAYLLAHYPGLLGGSGLIDAVNCREPISEGTIDARFALLALRMVKEIHRQADFVFALGMGSAQARFPRLLRGAGWTISPVPFLFRVARAGKFLRELRLLQRSAARRMAARVGAATGAGGLGVSLLQARSIAGRWAARRMTIRPVEEWGEWADALWERFQPLCSFAVARDRAMLREMYPLGDDRTAAYLIERDGHPVGWSVTLRRDMQDNQFFGNMRVGTILDCVAHPEAMRGSAALTAGALVSGGADLVVTNQSHAAWIGAFRGAGFLNGPSNYILALSKRFSSEVAKQTGGRDRMHFTRGDSDGRVHL